MLSFSMTKHAASPKPVVVELQSHDGYPLPFESIANITCTADCETGLVPVSIFIKPTEDGETVGIRVIQPALSELDYNTRMNDWEITVPIFVPFTDRTPEQAGSEAQEGKIYNRSLSLARTTN